MVLQYLLFIYGGFLFPFGSRAFPLTFGALLKQLLKVFVRKISRTMSSQHWSSWDFPGSSYAKYPGYFEYYVMGLWLFLKFYVIKKKKVKSKYLTRQVLTDVLWIVVSAFGFQRLCQAPQICSVFHPLANLGPGPLLLSLVLKVHFILFRARSRSV